MSIFRKEKHQKRLSHQMDVGFNLGKKKNRRKSLLIKNVSNKQLEFPLEEIVRYKQQLDMVEKGRSFTTIQYPQEGLKPSINCDDQEPIITFKNPLVPTLKIQDDETFNQSILIRSNPYSERKEQQTEILLSNKQFKYDLNINKKGSIKPSLLKHSLTSRISQMQMLSEFKKQNINKIILPPINFIKRQSILSQINHSKEPMLIPLTQKLSLGPPILVKIKIKQELIPKLQKRSKI